MDEQNEQVLALVRRRLEGSRGRWPVISKATGVPYFTIANIVSGKSLDPRIGSLQPLLDYFGIVAVQGQAPVAEASA